MSRTLRPLAALAMVAMVALISAGCGTGSSGGNTTGANHQETGTGSSGDIKNAATAPAGTGSSGGSKNASRHEKAVRFDVGSAPLLTRTDAEDRSLQRT
jgi:hypothetical protein